MRYFWRWIKGFFCRHEVEYLVELNILAKARCVKCGEIMCCNKELGSAMPWDASWDHEFEKMKLWRNL